METVDVMYKRKNGVAIREREIDGKLGLSYERMLRIEKNGRYLIYEGIEIVMDDTARSAGGIMRRHSAASFVKRLADLLINQTKKVYGTRARCYRRIS